MSPLSAAEEAEQTLRRARRGPLWSPGPDTRMIPPGELPLAGLIPHRPPFLLLDPSPPWILSRAPSPGSAPSP
jgi:hypothetical protein